MSDLMTPPGMTILTGASDWFGRAYLAALAGAGDRGHTRHGAIRALVPSDADAAAVCEVHPAAEMNKPIACDVSRTMADLGYRPAIALEEGMRRSIRWCRDRGIEL